MNATIAESKQKGQNQEQELPTQITELQSQLDKLQAEEIKAGSGDDCHSNPKIDRELLQEPQSQSLAEEIHSHIMEVQTLEQQAKKELLSERNRIQTMHNLDLD